MAISTSVDGPSCRPPLATKAIAASEPRRRRQRHRGVGAARRPARRLRGRSPHACAVSGSSGGVRFHASPLADLAAAAPAVLRRRSGQRRWHAQAAPAERSSQQARSATSSTSVGRSVPNPAASNGAAAGARARPPCRRSGRRSGACRRRPICCCSSRLGGARGVDPVGDARAALARAWRRRPSRAGRCGSPSGSPCTRRGRREAARAPAASSPCEYLPSSDAVLAAVADHVLALALACAAAASASHRRRRRAAVGKERASSGVGLLGGAAVRERMARGLSLSRVVDRKLRETA